MKRMVREGKEQVFNQYWKKDAICISAVLTANTRQYFLLFTPT